jgi:hypothetical protein
VPVAPVVPVTPSPVPGALPPAPIPAYGMPLGAMTTAMIPWTVPPLTPNAPFGIGMPLGVPPTPYAAVGLSPTPVSQFGMPPLGVLQGPVAPFGMPLGVPPAPIHGYGMGMAPSPITQFGAAPFGAPQVGISPYGTPLGTPPAPIPGVVPQTSVPGMLAPPAPLSPTASFLLGQIALKEAASRLGDEALKARVIAGADEAITRTIEDVAGVTLQPWARAGALTWVYPVVAELALLAHRYPEGAVRTQLLNVAGQLLSKGFLANGEGDGSSRKRG